MGLPLQREKEILERKLMYLPHDLDYKRQSRQGFMIFDFSFHSKSQVFHRFLERSDKNQ